MESPADLYDFTWPRMKAFMRSALRMLGGFQADGQEHIPAHGGVLICPNHVSDADPSAVAVALPRNAWFMAKAELFQIPVVGALIRHWHGFPVQRRVADRGALRRAQDLLESGEAVVIFPEGGGNPQGRLQPLQPGAMLVALRAGTPVVPAALFNTHRVWPHGRMLPRHAGRAVKVVFGAPLDLSDLCTPDGKKVRHAAEIATQRLTERLAEMLGQPVPGASGTSADCATIARDDSPGK